MSSAASNMMKTCCVVVPLYKEIPTNIEIASFKQLLKVLSNYDIIIYTYKELEISLYLNEARLQKKSLKLEYFDKDYFSSVKGYNRLCLTIDFYKRVSSYKYMLVYQLDAWVFRDELDYWCSKRYDYIGAPWFTNFGTNEDGESLWTVGNGGLSLRKIGFFIKFLSYRYPICLNVDVNNGIKAFVKSILKLFGFQNTMQWYVEHCNVWINEDYFFTNYIPTMSGKSTLVPQIPSSIEALNFSFERSPSYCYSLCSNKLPFGCHAFEKNEYETFWKKYIES